MRLTRFERDTQRLARPEQMLLADDVIERLRAQSFCEGNRAHPVGRDKTRRTLLLLENVGALRHHELELFRRHRRILLELLE